MSARVDSQHFLGRSPASVRLIDAFFETLPAERRDCLRRLQGQIDAVGVSVGTPAKAVENLMGTPTDRLSALLGYPATMAQSATSARRRAPATLNSGAPRACRVCAWQQRRIAT